LYLVFGRKLRPMRARQTAPYQGPGFAKTDIKLGSSRPFSEEEPERLPGPQSFAEAGVACEARICKVGPTEQGGGTR
jgi:hypothetical protein